MKAELSCCDLWNSNQMSSLQHSTIIQLLQPFLTCQVSKTPSRSVVIHKTPMSYFDDVDVVVTKELHWIHINVHLGAFDTACWKPVSWPASAYLLLFRCYHSHDDRVGAGTAAVLFGILSEVSKVPCAGMLHSSLYYLKAGWCYRMSPKQGRHVTYRLISLGQAGVSILLTGWLLDNCCLDAHSGAHSGLRRYVYCSPSLCRAARCPLGRWEPSCSSFQVSTLICPQARKASIGNGRTKLSMLSCLFNSFVLPWYCT